MERLFLTSWIDLHRPTSVLSLVSQNQLWDPQAMADVIQNPRTLRVFVASPSDVAEERGALEALGSAT